MNTDQVTGITPKPYPVSLDPGAQSGCVRLGQVLPEQARYFASRARRWATTLVFRGPRPSCVSRTVDGAAAEDRHTGRGDGDVA